MSSLTLPLEFNVWSDWGNRNGGEYIRNRTCKKNDGKSKVKVSSTKCNGSDFEVISNELLMHLFKKICLFMKSYTEYKIILNHAKY